jgi:hypothetical protein
MTEVLEIKLCRCDHSPSDHIHEIFVCKIQGCQCRDYEETSRFMEIETVPKPTRWKAGRNSA